MVRSEDSQYTQPYTGMIPIRSGEIAEDFAMYLADSEQTNSAVGLGVAIGTDLSVLAAGGFLVNVSGSQAATAERDPHNSQPVCRFVTEPVRPSRQHFVAHECPP